MDNLDANDPKKEYTGVWIPAEVMECDRLEPLDKLVYGEIAGFKSFYGSNAWLAKRVKRSTRTVIDSINRLVELGFVKKSGFNGRFRILTCEIFRTADVQNMSMCEEFRTADVKNSSQQTCEISHTENKVKNKVEYTFNKLNGETQNEGAVEKSEYGNHEVNALLELWEHETGLTANVAKANRMAAWNLLRRFGFDGAKKIIELCGEAIKSGDQYAPRISSFRDLQGKYEKLSKLQAWNARRDIEPDGLSLSYYDHQMAEPITEIDDSEREKVRKMIQSEKVEFMRRMHER